LTPISFRLSLATLTFGQTFDGRATTTPARPRRCRRLQSRVIRTSAAGRVVATAAVARPAAVTVITIQVKVQRPNRRTIISK